MEIGLYVNWLEHPICQNQVGISHTCDYGDAVFWNMMSCLLVGCYQHFWKTSGLPLLISWFHTKILETIYQGTHCTIVHLAVRAVSCSGLDTFIYKLSLLFRLFLLFKIVTTILRNTWGSRRCSACLSFVFLLLWRPITILCAVHHVIRQSFENWSRRQGQTRATLSSPCAMFTHTRDTLLTSLLFHSQV